MNQWTSILIGLGLIALGVLFSYLLSKRKNYHTRRPDFLEDQVEKAEPVKHYETARDKIVKKNYKTKNEESEEGYSFDWAGLLPRIIGFVLVLIVGSNILGAVCGTIVADNVSYTDVPGGSNVIGMMCTEDGRPGILLWFPIILGAVFILLQAFRWFGDDVV